MAIELNATEQLEGHGMAGADSSVTGSVDCLIIGGGPAGLTAAIYAARFHLSVLVIDAGGGRAAQIPCTRNHAGFPDGISGQALLDRMRRQAALYGAKIVDSRVETLVGRPGAFTAATAAFQIGARAVLLCTGVTNHHPGMPKALHRQAVIEGRIRYCPVCDGFEVTDKTVAVIGQGSRAAHEARFLRAYTNRVTLISDDPDDGLCDTTRAELTGLGIALVRGPPRSYGLAPEGLVVGLKNEALAFDAVYPALGSTAHSALAAGLGAGLTELGCVKVDEHQRTTVEGLYAAGDVVVGLDQISHAMGEAGVAATAIRNDLATQTPILRGRPKSPVGH